MIFHVFAMNARSPFVTLFYKTQSYTRKGVARSDITALRAAFQMLAQGEGTFQDRARRLGQETESEYVRQIVDFITAESDRSFLTPGRG